jgi:hypothetical protein
VSFFSKFKVEFLTNQNQISKTREYSIGSLLLTPVTLSNIKDLLLLDENYYADAIAIHNPNSMKAQLLQVHKMTKRVVHNFGHTISILSSMKLYLLNITGIPSSDSHKNKDNGALL